MQLIDSSYEIWNQDCDFISMQKQIEKAGRICYKSENSTTEESYKSFVERMIKSKHHAMLEQGTVYLYDFCETNTDHFADFINLIEKYKKNPYSKVVVKTVKDNDNNLNNICHAYITTNYRVIIENGWESDLKYITKEIYDDFEKRITVHFTLDCGIGREFTRHRVFSFAQESTRYCSYNKDKFGNEITFIKPFWYGSGLTKKQDYAFLNLCEEAEKAYLEILNVGGTAQEAREVLPLATKSELVMTGFINDWKHFFDLRALGTTGAPHPGAKKLAEPLMKDFQNLKLI